MCDSPPPNTDDTSNGILYLVIGAVVFLVALASIGGIIYMRGRHNAAREFVDEAEERDSTDYSNPSPLHVSEGAREKV